MKKYIAILWILAACSGENTYLRNKASDTTAGRSSAKAPADSTIHMKGREAITSADILDPQISNILSNLSKPEVYLHPAYGVYFIEPGPGVRPRYQQMHSLEELITRDEFMFLIKEGVPASYFVPDESFDPCDVNDTGIYSLETDKDMPLLSSLYRMDKENDGDKAEDKKLNDLLNLEKTLYKAILVHYTTRSGDEETLKMYFSRIKDRTYLTIIDISGCDA